MEKDRHADFEWRKDIIKQKNSSSENEFKQAMKKTQLPLTFESLIAQKKELLKLQQSIGKSWFNELIEKQNIEKKTFFGSKKIVSQEQVNENKRIQYYSYFISLKDWFEYYKNTMNTNEDANKYNIIVNSIYLYGEILKSLKKDKVDITYLDENFYALINQLTQIKDNDEYSHNYQQAA